MFEDALPPPAPQTGATARLARFVLAHRRLGGGLQEFPRVIARFGDCGGAPARPLHHQPPLPAVQRALHGLRLDRRED